jgi:hypothetical protein
VIQKLRENSIQTIRDNADVLRHIIKNVSSRLVGSIQSPVPVTNVHSGLPRPSPWIRPVCGVVCSLGRNDPLKRMHT